MLRRHTAARYVLASAALAAGVLTGCGTTAAPAPETTAERAAAPAATPTPVPQEPVKRFDPLQPPGGEWTVDEQGREYFPYEIPKHEGHYLLQDEGRRVIIDHGLSLDVLENRDTTFVVKIYNTAQAGHVPAAPRSGPTPQELDAAAASYRPAVGTADRLRFQPAGEGLPTTGQWRQGFDLVDLDADGDLDILHGPVRKNAPTAQALINLGGGRWRRQNVRGTDGFGLDYGDVAVADFDGDGRQDLAFAVHLKGLKVLVARADGSFADWSGGLEYAQAGEEAPSFTSRTLETLDWNGDGRMDLLALGEGPRMAVGVRSEATGRFSRGGHGPVLFLNRGDGTWERRDQGTEKEKPYGDAIVVGDFDGDGDQDFVTATRISGQRGILHLRDGEGWKEAPLPTLRPGIVLALAAADFDGDGRQDIAVGYRATELAVRRGGLDVHLQRPAGEWQRVPLHAAEDGAGISAVASGDLDGDGAIDLFGVGDDGSRLVFLGDGRGGFVREESPELPAPTGCTGYEVAIADLDGDRAMEVVMAFAGESGTEMLLGAPGRCPSQGGVEAWEVAPAAGAGS